MSEATPAPEGDRPPAGPLVDAAARLLALAGGLVLLAAAVVATASVASRWAGGGGVTGDFEMVEMATALAVFAFLPLCQARRGNIMVDTFTGRLPERARRVIDALWDLVWAGLAALIAWQSFVGGREEVSYGTTTMAAGLPIGLVIIVTAVLAAVLAVVAVVTAIHMLKGRS